MTNSTKKFFWIDLEMTGLDFVKDRILEVAVVITDTSLKPLAQYHRIVYQPENVLLAMGEWCRKTHTESGLAQQVPQGMPLEKVESELIDLLAKHYLPQDQVILAGNSIATDRRFLENFLPEFYKRLHYRMIDVSSFKEIFQARYQIFFEKKNGHRALDDIHESIRELVFYLSFIPLPLNTQDRPSFQKIYLQLARTLATRSTCQRLQVGTVITSTDYRKVLAIGYNGNATGLPHQCDRQDPGNCGCLHSEENAVINCDAPRTTEKIIFVTHLPCVQCAKRFINLGYVKKVYYEKEYRLSHAIALFEKSDILVEKLDL
jgi:oligoribonuclease (3'-5' exoribonuclease)/tRNA(Arg) A34 adenosine deaminase TadA